MAKGGMNAPKAAGMRMQALRAVAFAALLALLAACARDTPETRLRDSLAGLQAAFAERDPAAMQQYLASDFIGNDGLDREGARRMAAAYLLRYRHVALTLGPGDFAVSDTQATVRFAAFLRGGEGRALPDAASVYDVHTQWRLDDGDWRLVSARWERSL